MARFHKQDIVRLQLQTAVEIFLSNLNYSAVITLAGATSAILDTLMKRAGKESFDDYARRVHCELEGYTPKRQAYSHHIAKKLGIIAHKHLSSEDDETIELNLEKLAADALTRAIADYSALYGQSEPFVSAFLNWAWANLDGPSLMKDFSEVSDKMRRK
ncbi:hypothetical protein [Pseudomonas capeferrum]